MTDGPPLPFRKPSGDLTVRFELEQGQAPSRELDRILDAHGSPAMDVTLTKGARTRRYHVRPGRDVSEWYCQVWLGLNQHRGDRVGGVVEAQRYVAQYRREIEQLLEDGWSIAT